jgi:hypothetical protein
VAINKEIAETNPYPPFYKSSSNMMTINEAKISYITIIRMLIEPSSFGSP